MAEEQVNGKIVSQTGAAAEPGAHLTVSPPKARRRIYWAEVLFAAMLLFYGALAALAYRFTYFSWDLWLARAIQSIDLPGFQKAMEWVSAPGSGWTPWVLIGAAGVLLIAARFRWEGIVLMAGTASGSLLNQVLKAVVARPRPEAGLVNVLTRSRYESFPSGHVMLYTEYFGFLLILAFVLLRPGRLRRAAMAVCGAMIALVGVSRVYLGTHWPSDVMGGYVAGGIWLMVMIESYRRVKPEPGARRSAD